MGAIRDSFVNRSFDVDAIAPWIVAVAVACLILIVIFTIRAIFSPKKTYTPSGSITDTETIRMFLRQAFEQRRPFELQVSAVHGSNRPSLRTSPEYMGPGTLTVEVNGVDSLSERWIGREVNVFFRVNIDGDFIYYTFTSKIQSIHCPMKGLCHVTLPLPEMLENRQKRAFLRIRPPDEYFRGAAMWIGSSMPEGPDMGDLTAWKRPDLLVLPNRLEQFHILNISAGGMRLRIPHNVVRAKSIDISEVDRAIIMIDLIEPENSKLLRFWLQSRIQSVFFEHPSRDLYLGVKFQTWGRPREIQGMHRGTSEVEWLLLPSSNEVEPIGNWIMRRHLELFRDMPEGTH